MCPAENCGAKKVFAMKSILKTIGEVSLETRDEMIERPQETANHLSPGLHNQCIKVFYGHRWEGTKMYSC